jgi:hypothetical protein
MSSLITEAFVKQYSANIFHLSQQKGSRLRSFVRSEAQKSKYEFFERLGATAAVLKASRHGDTPLMNSDHSRRRVGLADYEWADMIDNEDKIRTLIDPQSAYVQSAMMAMGRSMDDVIIEAALGTAYSGEEGATSVILPASQYVGAVVSGTPAVSNLNVETLIRVKSKFGVNDVDSEIPLHIAVTQSQIDAMLGQTSVTSADYNNVKALVEGKVDTFMGFKFHRIQRLPTAGSGGFLAAITTTTGAVALSTGNGNNCRRCFAWAQDGLVLSVGQDMLASIDKRADKSLATQVYARMSIGATRLEENKVVGILCTES